MSIERIDIISYLQQLASSILDVEFDIDQFHICILRPDIIHNPEYLNIIIENYKSRELGKVYSLDNLDGLLEYLEMCGIIDEFKLSCEREMLLRS